MRKLLRVIVPGLALVGLTTAAVPAANASFTCVEFDSWTFTGPITLGFGSGQAGVGFTSQPCVNHAPYGGSDTYGYGGNCALTVLAQGTVSIIVGGVVNYYVDGNHSKVVALVPNSPCPISTASGAGVFHAQ